MTTPEIARLRELFNLDESTGYLHWRKSTGRAPAGSVAGYLHEHTGYIYVGVDGKMLRAHRVVFAIHNGFWPDAVDHINGKKTDNRPANLRESTQAQNVHNSRRCNRNTSGVKGVSWDRNKSKWVAECMVYGVKHHLGGFDDLEAAASAVRSFREMHHGAFARHE